MEEKEKNKNYHTVLLYTEIHEQDKVEEKKFSIETKEENKRFQNLSKEEIDKYIKELNQLMINCLKSKEAIPIRKEYYHDIVNDNGRPDYRTVEVICLMKYMGMIDDKGFCVYNGYKVKPLSGGFYIYLGHLIELGSNLNLHLLSYFFIKENKKEYLTIKTSCIELQKFFNETEENIRHALVSLQNLNLITFSEDNSNDIVINLNKGNILKLDKKHSHYSFLEEEIAINNYYKEHIIKLPSCPHCFEKFSYDELKLIIKNYDRYII
jgi:hypothetical protein